MKQLWKRCLIIGVLTIYIGTFLYAQPYRVQVAAFVEQVPTTYFTEANMFGVFVLKDQNNIFRYYLGEYGSKQEAELVQTEAIKKGFKYAQIIDIEEQRRLCGLPCPYISQGNTYTSEATDFLYVKNIFFGYDQSKLTIESKKILKKIAKIMKNNPSYKLMISGHTDSKGPAKYNVGLSKRRARSAKYELINYGIKSKRLKAQVFGESKPQETNDNPKDRRYNRRVVLAIYDPANGEILKGI